MSVIHKLKKYSIVYGVLSSAYEIIFYKIDKESNVLKTKKMNIAQESPSRIIYILKVLLNSMED